MTAVETYPSELPGCSIALKCANDPLIVRCLDSIDDDVSVNVVVTPNPAIESILEDRGLPYTVTEFGNIAKSTQLSVEEAEHDNVIVMDSDTWFEPGSIRKLREALLDNVLAKGRVVFREDSFLSGVIARHRNIFNSQPQYVTNPGLAIRREEVTALCRGYLFNPLIRWTEDADLNYRAQQAKVPIEFVPEAVINHDPVSLQHELKAAFLYGIGKRLSIENTPDRLPDEEVQDIVRSIFEGAKPRNIMRKIAEQGIDGTSLDILWQTIYLTGYHAQKSTKHWSVG